MLNFTSRQYNFVRTQIVQAINHTREQLETQMKTQWFGRLLAVLFTWILLQKSLAQNQPPFRIGINFLFVGASSINIINTFTNLAALGVGQICGDN